MKRILKGLSATISAAMLAQFVAVMPIDLRNNALEYNSFSAYAETSSNEEMYQSVLDMYYENIVNHWENFNFENGVYGTSKLTLDNGIYSTSELTLDNVSYMWFQYNKDKTLSETGYQFIDLNNDGVDELIVSIVDELGNKSGIVYDIYTFYNGKIIHLAASGERDRFYIGNTNEICEEGSGSALVSNWDYYHISNGTLKCFEAYLFDAWEDENQPYFYVQTPDSSYYDSYGSIITSKMNHITEEEFNSGIASHSHKELQLTLFSDYKSNGSNAEFSGKCGDSAYWNLDESTGTLTISGTGAIYDYNDACPIFSYDPYIDPPYCEHQGYIRSIDIQEGITAVGNKAFYGSYTAVTEYKLPESLEYIGDYAFYTSGDEDVPTSITIPKNVTHIGEMAIGYHDYNTADENNDLISIQEKIPGLTIYGYEGSEADRYAGENDFNFIALDDFEEIPEEKYYDSIDGNYSCKIVGEEATIVAYKGNEVNLTIPEYIDNYRVVGISGIEVPENDYKIYGAFEDNETLETVEIPQTVTTIDDYAFFNCSSLNAVYGTENVISVGTYAFGYCTSLNHFVFGDCLGEIHDYAFEGCNFSEVEIPRNLLYIGTEAVGYNENGEIDADCTVKCHYLKGDKTLTKGSHYIDSNDFSNYEFLYDNEEEQTIGAHYYWMNINPDLFFPSFEEAPEGSPLRDVYNYKSLDLTVASARAAKFTLDTVQLDLKAMIKDSELADWENMYKITIFETINNISKGVVLEKTKENYKNWVCCVYGFKVWNNYVVSGYQQCNNLESLIKLSKNFDDTSYIPLDLGPSIDLKKHFKEYSVGAVTDVIADLSSAGQSISEMAMYVSFFEALAETYDYLEDVFQYMIESNEAQNNEDLKEALQFYIDFMKAKSNGEDAILQFTKNQVKNCIENTGNEIVCDVTLGGLMKYISSEAGFGKVAAVCNDALKLFTKYSGIDEQQECLARLIALNNLHKAVVNSIINTRQNFKNDVQLENALKFHTASVLYFAIDKYAIETAKRYMELSLSEHLAIKMFTMNPKDVFTIVFDDDENKKQACLSEYINLINIQERLDNYLDAYRQSACCKDKNELTLNYEFEISGSVVDCDYTGVIVACPVDVELYYKNQLVKVVKDDCELWHNNNLNMIAMSLNEENSDTKGKLLLYPDNEDYSYKIVGNDSGTMYITGFDINSRMNTNVSLLDAYTFAFSDIPVEKNDIFVMDNNGKKHALNNTVNNLSYDSDNKNDNNKESSGESLSESPDNTPKVNTSASSPKTGDSIPKVFTLLTLAAFGAIFSRKRKKD